MSERPIIPGSGLRLRRNYLLHLFIATIVLPAAIVAVVALARGFHGPALTAILALTTLIVTTALLIPAVIRGRRAVTADTINLPLLRASGRLSGAAQLTGLIGGAVTIIVGFLQQFSGADTGVDLGAITAVLCFFAGSTSGIVNRLSHRLTT